MKNFLLPEWVSTNPELAISGLVVICLLAFIFSRQIVARGIIHLTARSTNKKDDILVFHLKPYRLAWFAPLIILNASSVLFPKIQAVLAEISLFLIIWLGLLTVNSILDAVNDLYEKSNHYNGVSIQSYLDLAKIFFIFVCAYPVVSGFICYRIHFSRMNRGAYWISQFIGYGSGNGNIFGSMEGCDAN